MKKTLIASLLAISMTTAFANGHYQRSRQQHYGQWIVPMLILGGGYGISQVRPAPLRYIPPVIIPQSQPMYIPQPAYNDEPAPTYYIDDEVYSRQCGCWYISRNYFTR
jgi:hypothetical protein